MFKPLNNYFKRKIKNLNESGDSSHNIVYIINNYLADKFGKDILKLINIEFNIKSKSLLISSSNKSLASEILFIKEDLIKELESKGERVNNLIIR